MQILMPQIRVRKPFAGAYIYFAYCNNNTVAHISITLLTLYLIAAFVALCLIAAYLGLTPNKIPQYGQSDKGLHFVTFFLLTVSRVQSVIGNNACDFHMHYNQSSSLLPEACT